VREPYAESFPSGLVCGTDTSGTDTSARTSIRDACVSVHGVTRFVVDCQTLLRIAAGEIEVAAGHKLVAPTLVRSQALSALYEAARRQEISAAEGIERVTRINSLKVRFLGDKVLQRQAWKVADQLGWDAAPLRSMPTPRQPSVTDSSPRHISSVVPSPHTT